MIHTELTDYLENISLIHKYAFVDEPQVVFTPEYREYCAMNDCGNYNANYSCPPYCGTPEEMEAKARRYNTFLVVQTIWNVKDPMNAKETGPCKKQHNAMSYEILEELDRLGIPHDAMLSGCCNRCEGGCLMKKGLPCVRDYHIYSCASAYCLNIAELAAAAHMDCWGDANKVHLFSVFLLDPKAPTASGGN